MFSFKGAIFSRVNRDLNTTHFQNDLLQFSRMLNVLSSEVPLTKGQLKKLAQTLGVNEHDVSALFSRARIAFESELNSSENGHVEEANGIPLPIIISSYNLGVMKKAIASERPNNVFLVNEPNTVLVDQLEMNEVQLAMTAHGDEQMEVQAFWNEANEPMVAVMSNNGDMLLLSTNKDGQLLVVNSVDDQPMDAEISGQ